jgi:hypothetical protein
MCVSEKSGYHRSILALLFVLLSIGCGSEGVTRPTGQGWIIEKLASGNLVGIHSGLTTTSDGTVHVVYHEGDYERLYHARRTGPDQWVNTRIDSIGRSGRYVTIETGPDDTLHLAYQDNYHADLRYAKYDGSLWNYERFQPSESFGGSPELIIESDTVHLLEINIETDRINYWIGSFQNWRLAGQIFVYKIPVNAFDFTLGPDGPVIAVYEERYSQGATLAVKTAVAPESLWTSMTVATSIDPGSAPSCEYDNSGILHTLYQNANGRIYDTAAGMVDEGTDNAMILLRKGPPPNGRLWVLYAREEGLGLAALQSDNRWQRQTVISNLDPTGQYDLHVAQDGSIHICFYSNTLRELYYGRWEGMP